MANHVLKNENKSLLTLFSKLNELRQYNTLLARHLTDSDIAKHCQVVNFEKNCLFIIADNGNWATQLRFHIPDLMLKLREHAGLESLSGIICKTRPASSTAQPSKQKARIASSFTAETAEAILEIAKTIQDKKLREIMEKIAGSQKRAN